MSFGTTGDFSCPPEHPAAKMINSKHKNNREAVVEKDFITGEPPLVHLINS